jgi:hypothetical protein
MRRSESEEKGHPQNIVSLDGYAAAPNGDVSFGPASTRSDGDGHDAEDHRKRGLARDVDDAAKQHLRVDEGEDRSQRVPQRV